jgi:cell division septation protein DedD
MDFMEEVKNHYDIIIFDSTPVLSAADAAILGQKVDGVLIVYRVGAVSRGLLKRTSTQLQQVKCNIIGIILNGMKPDISPDFPDYKYYKYYSYYGQEGKQKRSALSKRSFFSFFRRKGEDPESSVITPLPSHIGELDQEDSKGKKTLLVWTLIIVALVFLAAGILRQTGTINFARQDRGADVEPPGDKKALNNTAEIDSKTNPAATPLPVENSTPEGGVKPAGAAITALPTDKIKANDDNSSIKEANYPSEAFPFSLYLGSSTDKEKVEKAITQYSREGLAPFWVRVNLKDKGFWYRIYAGYFKDREEAQSFINEHNLTEAEVKNTAYANLIGIYHTADELENKIRTIKDLGYSPYTVIDQDSRSALFVGSFITEEGAEELNRELQARGIDNRVVKR